jgi:translocator protein
MKRAFIFILCVLGLPLLGGLGAIFTMDALPGWYQSLQRPPGVPPNTVFGPVWGVLYMMMGLSLALVLLRVAPGRKKQLALLVFAAQLVLNLLWTPVFFGAQQILAGLVIIVSLWVGVLLTIRLFFPLDRTAAWLLFPYAAWVSYASYLNAGFFWLNR